MKGQRNMEESDVLKKEEHFSDLEDNVRPTNPKV